MLIQRKRAGGLRLIEQHAHGLICGPMAQSWRGPGAGAGPPPFEATVAIGLHDYAWREADARPEWNPATGLPHDFLDYPHERRLELYQRGIDALEAIHPYVAELVSRHYTSFELMARHAEYQADEAARRKRLAARRPPALAEPEREAHDVALLKLFDTLSLYVCLAAPSARPETLPSWLEPGGWARFPDGATFSLEWRGDDTLSVDPFPWAAPLVLTLPWRDLDAERFGDQAALDAAVAGARTGRWTVTLSAAA
jgi:hypothetical protein